MRTTILLPGFLVCLLLAGCSQNEAPLAGADPAPPANPRVAKPIVEGDQGGYMEAPSPEPESRALHGDVVLSKGLEGRFTPGMILFVIARDPDSDDPMPLAAKKIRVDSLPLHIDLTDEDSLSESPLPDSFDIILRLDSDGDLTTTDPSDLTAGPVAAVMGGHVELVLEGASS